jgi:hypothetical protein
MVVKRQKTPAAARQATTSKVVNLRNTKRKRVRKPPVKTGKPMRTKKANTRLSPIKATIAENKQRIWDMKIGGYTQHDMAVSLDISEARVSQLVKEVLEEKTVQLDETVQQQLVQEHARINQMIVSWHVKARHDPRSADVYLAWVERKHKIQGLDVSKLEMSGRNGGPIQLQASSIDISKLNDEELGWLEQILLKAGPDAALSAPPVAVIEQTLDADKIEEHVSTTEN